MGTGNEASFKNNHSFWSNLNLNSKLLELEKTDDGAMMLMSFLFILLIYGPRECSPLNRRFASKTLTLQSHVSIHLCEYKYVSPVLAGAIA